MNTKALRRTHDAMRAAGPEKYDQTKWARPCGTPACVAGWAVAAHGYTLEDDRWSPEDGWVSRSGEDGEGEPVSTLAQEILGLTEGEAIQMFHPCPHQRIPDFDDAMTMLEIAIDQDRVAWFE